jgi:hypothetical protein
MVYLVSYDLRKQEKDYIGLYEQLKSSPSWWHYLESTWLINTTESIEDFYKRLSAHLDQNDNILIIEFKGIYFGYLPNEAWDWIKQTAGY